MDLVFALIFAFGLFLVLVNIFGKRVDLSLLRDRLGFSGHFDVLSALDVDDGVLAFGSVLRVEGHRDLGLFLGEEGAAGFEGGHAFEFEV